MTQYDKAFWLSTAERAIKTFAQTFVAIVGTNVTGIWTTDVVQMVATAAAAAILSVCTSIATPGTVSKVQVKVEGKVPTKKATKKAV